MPPDAVDTERFARDTTVTIEFDQRILDQLDQFAAQTGTDRRTALHTLITCGYHVEAKAQRDRPTWQWTLPDIDAENPTETRRAIEERGVCLARWRVDPDLAEAAVAIWLLPRRTWACTVTTRPDPTEAEQWSALLAGTFDGAAWLGGQAIAPLTYELAASATGPIWTVAEGDRVTETGWEGYLNPDEVGEDFAHPPSRRPVPSDQAAFDAMRDAVEQAGALERQHGLHDRTPFDAEAWRGDLDEWKQVIEHRGGRAAATAIGEELLRWFEACYDLGAAEAAASDDFASGKTVGAAETHAATARKTWVVQLLDLPVPR